MTRSAPDEALSLLRLHLRQRVELGETELLLDSLSRAELMAALSVVKTGVTQRGPAAETASAGGAPVGAEASSGTRPATRATPAAPVAPPSAPDLVRISGLAELRDVAAGCPRCDLARSRRQVVFGEGNEQAELLVVGEAPGAEEDRTGRPFVGRAGQLLDRLLASIGLPRETVYICNVLKCRPPANRNPQPEEIEACSPYLLRQVELVAPKVILTVGTFAAQTLLDSGDPINRLRGRVHRWRGTPLVATYHPAALLRNSAWIRPTWEDLQRVRALLDGDAPEV